MGKIPETALHTDIRDTQGFLKEQLGGILQADGFQIFGITQSGFPVKELRKIWSRKPCFGGHLLQGDIFCKRGMDPSQCLGDGLLDTVLGMDAQALGTKQLHYNINNG